MLDALTKEHPMTHAFLAHVTDTLARIEADGMT